jgi:preprotein translocase subunit SecF
MHIIKPGRRFDFMGKRKLAFLFSSLMVLISIGLMFRPGLKMGTDFKGGTEIELAFTQNVDAAEIRAAADKAGFSDVDVVAITDHSNPNHFLIRVQDVSVLTDAQKESIKAHLCLVPEGGTATDGKCSTRLNATEIKFSPGGDKISVRYEAPIATTDLPTIASELQGVEGVALRSGANSAVLVNEREHKVELYLKSKGDQLLDGLRTQLGSEKVPEHALRVEWIGPKAGAQLRDAAIKSVAIAMVFIMAYVALRFDLRFAPGGIIALMHDVIIALGAMALTQREVTLSTVAALLTIVGYSINDTVIVYDRIRENLPKHRNNTFYEIINLSISEMLGRTIITSLVTSLSMVCFLFWGTGVIRDFAFTLLVGMAFGTFSSIYIAAPVTEWIDRRFFRSSADRRKPAPRVTKRADTIA